MPRAARPITLAIDIGGTGLKAALLGPDGRMATDRVRRPTTYPVTPDAMVAQLVELVTPLGSFDRVAVGFPGMVREGKILSAPHFVAVGGPGTKVSDALLAAWHRADLAAGLSQALGNKPIKVANDADVQGAAVVSGHGMELVLTLGTGVGTALYWNGKLLPHLELSHHPFEKGETYDQRLGDGARKAAGNERWNRRLGRAIALLDALVFFDHLYIGGGNSGRITLDLGARLTTVDNQAGILGGFRLWDRAVD